MVCVTSTKENSLLVNEKRVSIKIRPKRLRKYANKPKVEGKRRNMRGESTQKKWKQTGGVTNTNAIWFQFI